MKSDYQLIVLGSGPAGRRAAIQAAKLGKSVLVIEARAQRCHACRRDRWAVIRHASRSDQPG